MTFNMDGTGRQEDGDEASVEEIAQTPRDEVQQPVEVGLGRKRISDLVQRFELARPLRGGLVEPRILDRDRGLSGE